MIKNKGINHEDFKELIKVYSTDLDRLGIDLFMEHKLERIKAKTISDFARVGIDEESMQHILSFMVRDKQERRSMGLRSFLVDEEATVKSNGFLGITYMLARKDIPYETKELIENLYQEDAFYPYNFILRHATITHLLNEGSELSERALANFNTSLETDLTKIKELSKIVEEVGGEANEKISKIIISCLSPKGYDSMESFVEDFKQHCEQIKEIFSSNDLDARKEAFILADNFRKDSITQTQSQYFTTDYMEAINKVYDKVKVQDMAME